MRSLLTSPAWTAAGARANSRPRALAGDFWRVSALLAATLLIYRDMLSAFFWHDDFQMLKMVQRHTFAQYLLAGFDPSLPIYGPIRPLWQPLTRFVYWALGWRLFGTDLLGYHLTTLLVHALNVLLVYAVARSLLRRPLAARQVPSLAPATAAGCAGTLVFVYDPAELMRRVQPAACAAP